MAKNRDSFNFDDDLDFDLDKELGSIDFGDNSKPPKNKREAVQQSLKDVKKGFRDEIFENKLKTAGKLAKNSIPRSLRAEFGEISGLASDVKDIVQDSIGDIKKQTSGLSRALGKLLPENSKLAGLLKKVGDKLDDNSQASQEATKVEQENNEIQSGILATLGEMKDRSHTDAMLQQAIQNKQFASNIEMLKNIYAETKLQRLFHYEITNAYYRKSLELQYKQLFTQREILEVQKLAFTTHKNQLETLVLNTALPDYLKARGKEALEFTIKQRMRDLIAGNLFKSGSGFDKFSKNITRKLKGFMGGIKEGLSSANDMAGMVGDMSSMYKEMGMRPGEMLGSSIANFFNQYVGGKIGKAIEKIGIGKEGIFNIKEAMVDPRKFFKSVANKKDPKGINKLFSKLAKFGLGFTEDPKIIEASYSRANLDESAMFDGRAHQSLTKVIPGLLSKIHAETKMLRTGLKIKGDSSAHELVFDNKDDTFKTKRQLVKTLNREIRSNLKSNFKSTATYLHHELAEMDVGLSGSEASSLNRALLNYSMQPGSSVTAGTLYDPEFLKFIQDPKLADKLAKSAGKIRQYLVNHPDSQEYISGLLSSLKNNLPNLNKRYEDLYKSGHTDVLMKMKVAKRNKYSGELVSDKRGIKNQIYANYTDDLGGVDIPPWMEGRSSSIAGQLVGNKINSTVGGWVDKIRGTTADDVINGAVGAVATGAGYMSRGIDKVSGYASQASSAIEKRFGNTKAYKYAKELSKKAQRKAKKFKTQLKKNKTVQSILKSKSVKTVSGFLVDGASQVEDFFGRPKEEISADLIKAYKDAKSSATNFINKTTTAVTTDTDVQALENTVKEGMSEISNITKKIILGEATKEDIKNFKETMKVRGNEISQTAKSAGKRGKAVAKDAYATAKEYGIKAQGKVQEAYDKVSGDSRFQSVASRIRKGWDSATDFASQAAAAAKDPKAAVEFAKSTYGKLKKMLSKPIETEEAMKIFSKWKASCKAEGIRVDDVQFPDWCRDFDIKLKNTDGPGGVKGFFQWTRKWDKKIWTGAMKGIFGFPFKFMGGMLSNTRIGNTIGKIPGLGKLTGLNPSGFSAQAGNVAGQAGGMLAKGAASTMGAALDMLPLGMGEVVKAPFQFMGTAVGIMGQVLSFMGIRTKQEDTERKKKEKAEAKKAKAEKEKSSSDGWMSRLKLWGRKKEGGTDDKGRKSMLDRLKENKTPLTIMGALLGIWGFTKMFNINIGDVIEGVKSVVGTVASLGKGLYDMLGGGFTGLAGLLATGFGIKKLVGWGLGKLGKAASWALGSAAGKIGGFVKNKITGGPNPKLNQVSIDSKGRYRTPDGKFAKNPNGPKPKAPAPKAPAKVPGGEGKGLWKKLGTGIKMFLSPWKDKVIGFLDKIASMWKTVMGKLGFLKKAVTKPVVAKKLKGAAISKLTRYIASAASGIGAILTLGFAIWDTAWVLKYMAIDGLSFWSALSKQMLGVDLFDKNVQKEMEIDENEEADKIDKKIDEDEAKTAEKKEEDANKAPTIGDRIKSGLKAADTAISMIPGVGTVYQGAKSLLGFNSENANIKGSKTAEKAADLVTAESTKNPTKGWCATAVNSGLRKVGVKVYGNGWQADQNLTNKGWVRVYDGSSGQPFDQFKPQKGDVISIGQPTGNIINYKGKQMREVLPSNVVSTGGRVYGHTAIFNGNKWVSDFVQNNAIPYQNAKNAWPYTTVLRQPANPDEGGEKGSSDISDFERARYGNRVSNQRNSIASQTARRDYTQNVVNIDTRSVTDVLRQSLQVHIQSRDLLTEIRDTLLVSANVQAQAVSQSPANNVMPDSVIRLTHNYN